MATPKEFARRTCIAALAACLTLFAATAAVSSEAHPDPLPTFTMNTMGGEPVNMELLRNFPVTVVVFFATWSPKSEKALTELQKIADKFEEQGVAVVGVNAEAETTDANFKTTLSQYLEKNKVTFTILSDEGLSTYRAWEIKAMPTTFVLDNELKVVHALAGAPTAYGDEITEHIEKKLGIEHEEDKSKKHVEAASNRYRPEKHVTLRFGMITRSAERGRVSRALKDIDGILETEEKFADCFAYKGALYVTDKKQDAESEKAAREAFAHALTLDPTLPRALIGDAWFAMKDGDFKKGIASANLAFEQTDWGMMEKPEDLEELTKTFKEASEKDSLDDAAKAALEEPLHDLLLLHKKRKVDRSKLNMGSE
ncbi:MAG: hypothetical protein C0609_10155 [Deltaproteobacteria bacterium]|nr:MAG: hypothetical protein C0609_10155 [Deltaproteobacteria bacterium]